ncbi:MAG: hypothetical protein AABX30_02310 [Nanoarchaeota archaeon]
MLQKGMSKQQIEKELEGKGDFVKINYLSRFLDKDISLDMKKFVYTKLSEIYEKMKMFNESGKMYSNLAEISITFSDKIKYHIIEAEAYIRAGSFDLSDKALKKALHYANLTQKTEIVFLIKEFYKKQANIYEIEKRRNHAVKIYEKLASMNLTEVERKEVKEKLMSLYQQLGMSREYNLLKGRG